MGGQSAELCALVEAFREAFPDELSPACILDIEPPTVPDILLSVAEFYGIKPEVIRNRGVRGIGISWARHVTAYLARQLTDKSHKQIMTAMGGFDHTISRHAEIKIAACMAENEIVRDDIDVLRIKIMDRLMKRAGSIPCQ